jgi:hypothetical protein
VATKPVFEKVVKLKIVAKSNPVLPNYVRRYRTELDIGNCDIGLKTAESGIMLDSGLNFLNLNL